jgi:hypothetical protein
MPINMALDADDAMEIEWYYCVDRVFKVLLGPTLRLAAGTIPCRAQTSSTSSMTGSGLFSAIEDYFVDWFPA